MTNPCSAKFFVDRHAIDYDTSSHERLLFIAKRIEFVYRMNHNTTKYNRPLISGSLTRPTPLTAFTTEEMSYKNNNNHNLVTNIYIFFGTCLPFSSSS